MVHAPFQEGTDECLDERRIASQLEDLKTSESVEDLLHKSETEQLQHEGRR